MANISSSAETEVERTVKALMSDHGLGGWLLNVWQRSDGLSIEVDIEPDSHLQVNGFVSLPEAQKACAFVNGFFKLPQGDSDIGEPAGFEGSNGHDMRLTVRLSNGTARIHRATLTEEKHQFQMGAMLVSLIDEIGYDSDANYLDYAARILGIGTAAAAWVIYGSTNATSGELRQAVDGIMNPPVEQVVELLMDNTTPEIEAALARHSENQFATESQNQVWGTF